MNAVSLVLAILATAPDGLDLAGRVTATDGAPIKGAHVLIYTARVRTGTSSLCPSCYADCSKRAETQPDGSFKIAALDPGLIFRVLVVADGYQAAFVDSVDPKARPIAVALARFDPSRLAASQVMRGIVLDPEGQPVAGAVVSPQSYRTEEWSGFKPGVFDPLAVTNLRGEFVLTARSPIENAMLKVEGRGLAPRIFPDRVPRQEPARLTVTRGATVTGRLVRAGQPVADASMGMVQANRGMGHFLGALEIGTNAQGRFSFLNVAPEDDYYVYGLMPSLKDKGAVPVKPVRVGADLATIDVGDLTLEVGHSITGRVILADGKPVPANTRLLIGRELAWDTQSVTLDPEGKFEVKGLPSERFSLSIAVKGYHLSSKNHSIDSSNPFQLTGTIDQDINGLKILLDPGNHASK